MTKKLKVGVVGSGINGIATSLALLQAFPTIDLTIYSENFSPNTTSDGSGGLWGPFIVKGTSDENIIKWSTITWDFLEARHKEKKSGIRLIPTTTICDTKLEAPFWKHIPYNYKELSQEELKAFGPDYINGYTYLSYIAESSIILTNLTNEVRLLGGQLKEKRLDTLMDIGNDVDVIINCSGLGAYNLVPDFDMFPVRGQVMRVKCPSINFSVLDVCEDKKFSYIIPNVSSVVLGGTHQENDWRTTVDESDSKKIWENCTRIAPELKNCEVVKEWVGLRPVRRSGLRLEMEEICFGSKVIPVIHNYGHGGSGLTLFWGCALEVKEHVRSLLRKRYNLRPKL